jgi:uncharacterized protein
LFGILLMNMREFSGWGALPAADRSALTTPVDVVAELLHGWFFFHKFYSLFALFFGIGFAIQFSRMVARGADFRAVYLRRMAVLFVIGMLHMTLLYETDILALYAICGVLLMPFRRRSDRTLLVWAIALIVLPVALRTMILLSNGALDPAAPFWAVGNRISSRWGFPVGVAATHFMQTEGGWREFLLYNAANPPFRVASILDRGFLFSKSSARS